MMRADMISKCTLKKIKSYVEIFCIALIELNDPSLLSVYINSIKKDLNGTMSMCKRDEVDNQLYSDFRSTFFFIMAIKLCMQK